MTAQALAILSGIIVGTISAMTLLVFVPEAIAKAQHDAGIASEVMEGTPE